MRFEGYEGLRVFHVLIIIMVLRVIMVMRVYERFEDKYLTSSCILLLISRFKWLTDFKYDIYIPTIMLLSVAGCVTSSTST